MTTIQYPSTEFSPIITDLWNACGMELVIFAVTLTFALIIKISSSVSSQPRKPKTVKYIEDPPPQRPPAPPRRAHVQDQLPFKPGRIISDVVDTLREHPGPAHAARALNAHKQLRANLAEHAVRLCDVVRQSRHAPLDFYFALVQSCVRVGRPHLVEEIIEDMKHQGISRTLAFYESTMKQLAGLKHYNLALIMCDHLEADGLEPSAIALSCLISFATEVGELQRAIHFFQKLSMITTPSIRAYMTILRVYAKRQDWFASVETFRDMQRRGVLMDSLVLNVILATGAATDQVEGVEGLLKEVENANPPLTDVVSYNTLIKAHAQRGNAEKAIEILNQMRASGKVPNAITFNTAMDAAVRGTCNGQAWGLLREMRACNLNPDKFTCSILVKGLNKSPTAERVQEVITLLRDAGPACDMSLQTSMYQVVIEAAAQCCGNEVFAQIFSQMRHYNVAPTTTAYRILHRVVGKDGEALPGVDSVLGLSDEHARKNRSSGGRRH